MTPSKNISLRLLIDTKSQRVLFAEAGKEFVDFLFSFMSLPLATVVSLLSSNEILGALGMIHQSIENISDDYMQVNAQKETILKPKASVDSYITTSLLLPNYVSSSSSSPTCKKAYLCQGVSYSYVDDDEEACNLHPYVAETAGAKFPECKNSMTMEASYVVRMAQNKKVSSSSGDGGGYVKDVVTYMVMDDLQVMPMSSIASIALLNTFNVKDIDSLEEKTVSIGIDEVIINI